MQELGQYFVVAELCTIKGNCQQLISQQETKWRSFESFEEPPFQKVAKYMRNIEYCPQNVRTFEFLSSSFTYLVEKIYPLLLKKSLNLKEKYSISIFLEERLKAIRCELFVQGIICPSLILKLIRANILIEIMKENDKASNELVGLQHLLDSDHKETMSSKYPQQYQQALTIALLSCSRQQIQNLLARHEIIFDNDRLANILRLRLNLESINFQVYYTALSREQPLVQCLLWRKIETVKQNLVDILKKSYGDVPLGWLHQRLGLQAPEVDGWICLKQVKEPLKGVSKGIRQWVSHQGLQSLLSC